MIYGLEKDGKGLLLLALQWPLIHSLPIGDIEALRVRSFDPKRSRSRTTICVVVSQNSSKLKGSWGFIADGRFASK